MNKFESLLLLKHNNINTPEFFYIGSAIDKTFNIPIGFMGELVSIRSCPCQSMPGILDTKLNINCTVDELVIFYQEQKKLFNSPLAKLYREQKSIPDIPPGIIVQKMVDGRKGGSGVYLTDIGPNLTDVNEYKNGISGENIVQNLINSTEFDTLPNELFDELYQISLKLKKIIQHPIDIEYTVDSGRLYILQVRKLELNDILSGSNIYLSYLNKEIFTYNTYIDNMNILWGDIETIDILNPLSTPIYKGIPIVPGIAKGALYKDIAIFTSISNDIIPSINNYSGIITRQGSLTSHISIICRNLNKPYIICPEFSYQASELCFDGNTGAVYELKDNIFITKTKQDYLCVQ